MTAGQQTIRRVEVQPPSAGAELANVLRFALVVAIGVWMYTATDSSTFGGGGDTRRLLPFQKLVQDRPSSEQRIFRELQEGLLEAERRRTDTGAWPPVPVLASDGIPPFAFDPTAKDARYDWRLIRSGTYVNYLGLPQQPGAPAWLVLVLEPEQGAPPDPAKEDEEHHKLSTGVMLHVSTWVRADANVSGSIVRIPQSEGWIQLYAVGPSLSPPTSAAR